MLMIATDHPAFGIQISGLVFLQIVANTCLTPDCPPCWLLLKPQHDLPCCGRSFVVSVNSDIDILQD
jgi:hypothetical protein